MEPALESHLLKFGSLVPDLALLTHLADHPQGGPVGAGALKAAIAWAVYLESHARRLYASVTAPEMAAATALDKRLLAILEDHFRIRGERKASKQGEGGRPTIVYRVNPVLRHEMADRDRRRELEASEGKLSEMPQTPTTETTETNLEVSIGGFGGFCSIPPGHGGNLSHPQGDHPATPDADQPVGTAVPATAAAEQSDPNFSGKFLI